MFQEIVAALVSFFLLDPLQAGLADMLAAAGAPQAAVAEVTACAADAAPALVERVSADPWWGARTAFGVWIGTASHEAVLLDVAPGCGGALDGARPFLTGAEA